MHDWHQALGTGLLLRLRMCTVARILVVCSTETWINSVVFIWNFCVLYHWSCFFGQRYMVSEVETHCPHLLLSTNWPQVHEDASYWTICFQPRGEWIDLTDLQDFYLTFRDLTTRVKATIWFLPPGKVTAVCCLCFLRKFPPWKNLRPMKHATEAWSPKQRNGPGIWNSRAAKTSTNPKKHSITVKIRDQQEPSD